MEEKWEELVAVLDKILGIYTALLTLSQQKKQILVAAKAHDLAKIIKQEEILVVQLGKLENLRQRIVGELMVHHGITEGDFSLTELQKIVTPTIGLELKSFGEKINIIMEEIVPLNKLNSELIQQALGFINYNINILSQTVVGPTYAAKGQANEQTQRKVFDARA